MDINGGICFLHYDKTHNDKTKFTDGNYTEQIKFSEFDIIPDDPLAYALIRKIQSQWNGKFVGDVAWASSPFGLETNFFQKNQCLENSDITGIPCLSRGKQIKYVAKNQIVRNKDKIDFWKVSAPAAAGGSKGKRRSTIPKHQIFLLDKGVITTATYNIIDVFKNKQESNNLISLLQTDFARYLVGLRKITQHVPRDRWNWVPYMDVSRKWTDEDLFNYFNITPEEQAHIKNKVKEWS